MSNKSDYLTDEITESRHYAFRRVLPGYPLDEGETVYRVLAGNDFDPARCQGSTNLGNGRSQSVVGGDFSDEVAADYDWYIVDMDATKALRERLILTGEDNIRHNGVQFRPNRVGEPYTLLITKDDFLYEQSKPSTHEQLATRHYVVREVQQSEPEEKLSKAVNDLVTAIKESVAL